MGSGPGSYPGVPMQERERTAYLPACGDTGGDALQYNRPVETIRRSDPVRVDLSASHRGLYIEPRISLAYLPTEQFDPAESYVIDSELLRPYYRWWPRRLSIGPEGLREIEAETVLGRLDTLTLDAPLLKQGPLAAHEAVEWLLTQFQARAPWLEWEPVPPLFVLGRTGPYEPAIEAVSVIPEEDRPVSLAEVLRDWLGPFYGYGLHVTPEGKLEVVPPWWLPQAVIELTGGSASAALRRVPAEVLVITRAGQQACRSRHRLEDGGTASATSPCGQVDLSLSGGTLTATLVSGDSARVEAYTPHDYALIGTEHEEARTTSIDTSRVVNHAVVRNEGFYEFVGDQPVIQESYFKAWGLGWWCYPAWREFPHPTDAELGSPTAHDLGTVRWWGKRLAHDCSLNTWQYVGRAPAVANTFVGGDSITVSVTVSWWGDQCGDIPGHGHMGDSTADVTVPVDGEATRTFSAPVPGPAWPPCTYAYLELRFRPMFGDGGIFEGLDVWVRGKLTDIRIGGPPPIGDGRWVLGAGVFLSATAERWQESGDVQVGEWGEDVAGQDAITPGLARSVDLYGERRREIVIRTFRVDPDTLTHMARMIVERNLAPARVIEVLVPPPYAVGPDALGQRALLAGDEVGEVEAWRYTEVHAPGEHRANVSVRVRVTESLLGEELERCSWGEAAWALGVWCG